ncbi:MAG: ribonucleotide-diphosphate reductase subunit beta [Proteobacteria bacterium SG_bin5]|nr:50S ribosomal protein L11 methyltransferase [Sphingomonas sp.]OQW42031.1 MAG: ribonucleotide-diphosphate reductase subunit beta [Proteobacteria bacterium SG_bin5]
MPSSWKLTLPCTRAEAEAIDAEALGVDPAPVLTVREEVVDDPERWRLDAYFETKPSAALLRAVRALVPSAAGVAVAAEPVPEEDWVTLSQAGLDPVRAGRFFVHTSAYQGAVPAGARGFLIEASRAFGTGHHETTTGCLTLLDALRRRGTRVHNLIDLGTGTGLLAFAGLALWPRAQATATDIDPIAIEVARENAGVNGVALGRRPGALALGVADGAASPLIARRGPYDLVIANILAAPLIEHAGDFAGMCAPGGQLLLAGLLTRQADAVARAYRRQGCSVAERLVLGDWTILRLRKRAAWRGRRG